MEDYKQRIKENKNLLLLAGAVILALIIISVINPFKNNTSTSNTNTTTDTSSTTSKKVSEISINKSNKAKLTDALGYTIAQDLLEDLNTVNPYSTSVTDIPSLDSLGKLYPPYLTHALSIETSDNHLYDINIINKKNTCYGIIIHQTSPTNEQPYLYITNNSRDTSKYNSMISDIVNWAKKLYPNGIVVNTK